MSEGTKHFGSFAQELGVEKMFSPPCPSKLRPTIFVIFLHLSLELNYLKTL